MYLDSHCHLSFPELRDNLPALLAAMRAAGVHRAICISTRMEEVPQVLKLAQDHPVLWASVGVHPDAEPGEGAQEPTVDDLVAAAQHPRVVAIGETGLDYYRLGDRSVADMQWQRERLRVHVRAARQVQRPLVVHTRSSAADTLAILQEEGAEAVGGVFHCFTEDLPVAQAAVALGFYISFSGILTFRNAEALREVARALPLDRLLIETDSPYLAPVPHRGKTNQPAYVPHVAEALGALHGLSAEAMGRITTANAERLFRLPALE